MANISLKEHKAKPNASLSNPTSFWNNCYLHHDKLQFNDNYKDQWKKYPVFF